MIRLTLAVPCFNEEDNVGAFYEAVKKTFDGVLSYEIVFVNDGSTDKTGERLRNIYDSHTANVTVVSFSRNFGKEAAVYAALQHSRGELVCIIDSDMQQSPDVALEMVRYLDEHEDCDCCAAYQEKRIEGRAISFFKDAFYSFADKLSDVKMRHSASDFRVFRRNVAEALLDMKEYHRFSKGMFSWVGFNTHYIPYTAENRLTGETKWSFSKLMKYAFTGIISFSTKPLRIPFYLGGLFTAAGLIWLIVMAVLSGINGLSDNYRMNIILSFIMLMSGPVLICVGILCEYISQVFIQVKGRPIYIERSCMTYSEENEEDKGTVL